MEKDFTIKPKSPLFPPFISERKLTALKNDYPILYEFSELFDNGITPESFIKDKAAKCEYGEAAFFDLLKHEIGLLKHEIEFIKDIIESEGGTYIEYGIPLTFEEIIKGDNHIAEDVFYNVYVLDIEKIVSAHFCRQSGKSATPEINPKEQTTKTKKAKLPTHLTCNLTPEELTALFYRLQNNEFLDYETKCSHFCFVFGKIPIPEEEQPFTKLVWVATNKKAKNRADKRCLLRLLQKLDIPEHEIKNRDLLNSLFIFPKGKELSSANYTEITDNTSERHLLQIKSEYESELQKIVPDSKKKLQP